MVDVIRRWAPLLPGPSSRRVSTMRLTLRFAWQRIPRNKNQQASGAKGGKRGKGALVLDLSDPAERMKFFI